MKWIKYQIVQCVTEDGTILANKKIGYSEENLVIAQKEAYQGLYTIEEDDKTLDEGPLQIERPIILKEGIHYGKTLPTAGTPGRIFFLVVNE